MDEVAASASAIPNNTDEGDWWSSGTSVDDDALLQHVDDATLWSGTFVPPPPRPLFLDDSATPDGLTTCDLCSWAWQESKTFTLDAALEAPGELGWVLTLIIVSFISAIVGAIVMIVVLHCKRMKTTGQSERRNTSRSRTIVPRPPISTPDDKSISAITMSTFSSSIDVVPSQNGVWSWLSRRPTTISVQSQLNTATAPAENHYTHMDETYNAVDEALYAELDRESMPESSPAYQNSAYADADAPVSSAPSSAYYSDLSANTAYEVVGLATLPPWDNCEMGRRQPPRLASISETVSVPSDYV